MVKCRNIFVLLGLYMFFLFCKVLAKKTKENTAQNTQHENIPEVPGFSICVIHTAKIDNFKLIFLFIRKQNKNGKACKAYQRCNGAYGVV